MKTRKEKKESEILSETEQWLLEHARSVFLGSGTDSDPALEEQCKFNQSFWPFLAPYHSPLRPAFSYEVGGAERLAKGRYWLLRDGIIPLSWFFESANVSLASGCRLFVHHELGRFVPEEWRKATRLYRVMSSTSFHQEKPPRELLLYGIVNPGMCSLKELEARLARALELLGTARPERVSVYCPVRQMEYLRTDEASFEFQYFSRIISAFGTELNFPALHEIEHGSREGTAIWNLNSNWICSDDSVTQMLLRRGAGLLEAPFSPEHSVSRLELSPFHSVELRDFCADKGSDLKPVKENGVLLGYYSQMFQHYKENHSTIPWPRWYYNYLRVRESIDDGLLGEETGSRKSSGAPREGDGARRKGAAKQKNRSAKNPPEGDLALVTE